MTMILNEQNYVDQAEKVILELRGKNKKFDLTTSQIRKILTLTSALFDEARLKPFDQLQNKLAYLRVQIVYQVGRKNEVRDFVEKSQLLQALKEVTDTKSLLLFCRYMEALVAYFKFYGGKEN
ncbi:type III-A CRISPR-associated protein Csm2 [Facklamia hominis]